LRQNTHEKIIEFEEENSERKKIHFSMPGTDATDAALEQAGQYQTVKAPFVTQASQTHMASMSPSGRRV
jgi:hypothetical protein